MNLPISGQSLAYAKIIPQPQDFKNNNVLTFNLDFTGVSTAYAIDPTQQQQQALFRSIETLFVDNSANPNPIVVTISVTNQTFEVPPYSNGFYRIGSAGGGSILTMASVGGATAVGRAQIFDFPITPFVWYNAPGGGGNAITAVDGAIVTMGTKADAAIINPALSATMIALLKGILTEEVALASNIVWTQTIVALPAATSTAILGANALRRGLRWMISGTNPVTVVPGVGPAVAGNGFSYGGNGGVGQQGGGDTFARGEMSAGAFTAISTLGSTIVVWEGV